MNELEGRVLEMLLAGTHPFLRVLRAQSSSAAMVRREFTGSGFFTYLSVPTDLSRVGQLSSPQRDQ